MVGSMVVMLDETSEQVGSLALDEGGACDRCGRSWTGAKIAERDDDNKIAVLQYLHPDFEKLTTDQISEFAAERACSQCGDPTEELPRWMAERILRASPHLVLDDNFEAICEKCAANYFAESEGGDPTPPPEEG